MPQTTKSLHVVEDDSGSDVHKYFVFYGTLGIFPSSRELIKDMREVYGERQGSQSPRPVPKLGDHPL
jgi:hypothetical protein